MINSGREWDWMDKKTKMGKTKPNTYLPMLIKWYRHRIKTKQR
jgi:hypothetical protein